jgi:hypothetical protein
MTTLADLLDFFNTAKTDLTALRDALQELVDPISQMNAEAETSASLDAARSAAENGDANALAAYKTAIETAYGVTLIVGDDVTFIILWEYEQGFAAMAAMLETGY